MSQHLPIRSLLCLGLPLAVAACSSVPIRSAASGDPYQWLPGVYQMEGEILYRSDTPEREQRERIRILGEVTVGAQGPVSFETLLSSCLQPERTQDRTAGRRNGWDVRCGDAEFTLWPDHNTVRGSVAMMVTELRRVGACVQYTTDANGNRSCTRYVHNLQATRITRTGRVRSTLKR